MCSVVVWRLHVSPRGPLAASERQTALFGIMVIEKSGVCFYDIPELSQETLAVLETLDFRHATPVQEATIPLLCGNKVRTADDAS